MQKEVMDVTAADLSIAEIEEVFRVDARRRLARVGRLAVYFTEIPQLDYISALLVSPLDQVLLWAPYSVYQFRIPVSRPTSRRTKWVLGISESKSSKRKFNQCLLQGGSSMKQLPYGSIAYLGPDMGIDQLWSPNCRPLWAGWYRAYALPKSEGAKQAFVEGLMRWFSAAAAFGTRAVKDSRIAGNSNELKSVADLRDRLLFVSEPQGDPPREYRREYEEILSAVNSEIDRTENGDAMLIEQLSASFQIEDCRLGLIDYGVKDERRRLSEAIGKYRARLLRVLGWPIFVEVAATEIAGQDRFGRTLPAYGSEPTPFDGWNELSSYLQEMRLKFPTFFSDPLEDVYPE